MVRGSVAEKNVNIKIRSTKESKSVQCGVDSI